MPQRRVLYVCLCVTNLTETDECPLPNKGCRWFNLNRSFMNNTKVVFGKVHSWKVVESISVKSLIWSCRLTLGLHFCSWGHRSRSQARSFHWYQGHRRKELGRLVGFSRVIGRRCTYLTDVNFVFKGLRELKVKRTSWMWIVIWVLRRYNNNFFWAGIILDGPPFGSTPTATCC